MARIDDLDAKRRPVARPPATVTLVGINHRSATMDELDEAALDEVGVRRLLRQTRAGNQVVEAAFIATCNRTEGYLVTHEGEGAAGLGRELIQSLGAGARPDAIYVKFGRDAVAHLCRIAAGIDSLMVGEVQILGQVKAALALATEEECAGPIVAKLFTTAVRAGKRARTETRIGEGAVSVSYAALGLAEKIFSDLGERHFLLVGAGATAALAGRHFAEAGVASIVVANRTPERGARLARQLGGRAIPLSAMGDALAYADVVLTATSAPEPIITRRMVAKARAGRGARPLVLIDIALPRDVEPAVNELEGVFVHDMSALESIVERNRERRRREIPRVEAIVAEEVERHEAWERSLDAATTIRELRERYEAIRVAEVEEWLLKLPEADREPLERMSRSLVARLLHTPMTRIRRPRAEAGDPAQFLAAAREIFALDEDRDDPEPEAGPDSATTPDSPTGGEPSGSR